MALTIYRRHRRNCPYHRKPRNARNNRACKAQCPIWVQGTLAGESIRRSLDLRYWEAASALVRGWEFEGRIGAVSRPHLSPPIPAVVAKSSLPPSLDGAAAAAQPSGVEAADEIPTIEQSVERFMAALTKRNLSWETRRKYDALLSRRFLSWCAVRSYRALDELTVPRLDDFRNTWQDGPAYARANLARLRTFVQFCMDRDWISRNPAKALKSPQVRGLPTLPFSAEEMQRILAACDKYRGDKNRMRAFVLTMRYSGLRISDTIALAPAQLIDHRLRLYTTKTGEPVSVALPPFVVDALKRIERPGHRYFSTGNAKQGSARANWSRYLASLFRHAKIENGHSHRFRDTFSTSLLQQGVSDVNVASLLGTTPAVVNKHYAPWIKARQIALEAAVQTTWESYTARANEACGDPTR